MTIQQHIPESRYVPRSAWFAEILDCGPVTVKLSVIHATGGEIAPSIVEKARQTIARVAGTIASTEHQGAGFAVLHEGMEGRWLLLHWWIGGGVATRMLWRADLVPDSDFLEMEPLLLACVWELGVIDFERRAWMETAMSGRPVSDYLALTLPRGTV